MISFVASNKKLDEWYKKRKLTISIQLLKSYKSLSFIILSVVMILSWPLYDLSPEWYIFCGCVVSVLFATKELRKRESHSYMVLYFILAVAELNTLYAGFIKHPEYSFIYSGLYFFYLWHGHLELTYSPLQAYFTIALHIMLWCFFFIFSIPYSALSLDVLFSLVLLSVLQLFWYKHKISKEIQEIFKEIELENVKSNMESLMNSLTDGLMVIDETLKIITSNHASQQLLQSSDIFKLKLTHSTSKKNSVREELINCLKEFKASNNTRSYFGTCKIGDNYIECIGNKVMWDKDPAIIITLKDISSTMKLERKLDLASKTLKICQSISDEFKKPLDNIINEHHQILATEICEPIKVHVNRALGISKRLVFLSRDINDCSFMKFNNLTLNLSWIGIDQVVLETIQILKDINSSCNITYTKKINEIVNIHADSSRAKQCILNIISFSLGYVIYSLVDFSTTKIYVERIRDSIRMSIRFDSVENYVMDSKATLEYLHQLSLFKATQGMLKLICGKKLEINAQDEKSIVFSLIFNHISIVSLDCIPDIPEEGSILAPHRKPSMTPFSLDLIDILIVNDIQFNIAVLTNLLDQISDSNYLNNQKYTVHSARSGKEAIQLLIKQSKANGGYRIIIMDCLMPELDGWETAIAIRKFYAHKQIRVLPYIIAYSALNSKEDIIRSEFSGMCDHISKPCTQKNLASIVIKWMDKPIKSQAI